MSDTAYDLFTSDAWQRHASDEDDIGANLGSYVGDPPAATSVPPFSEFTPAQPDTSELHAGHFLGLLAAIAEPVQGWTQYRETISAISSSGAAIMTTVPVRPGWEAKVTRLTLSVGGASAAATAAIYVGPEFGETAAPSESYLTDFVSALLGNTPSRVTSTPVNPYWLTEHDTLAVVLAAVAAGSNQCFGRIEGWRRQKL